MAVEDRSPDDFARWVQPHLVSMARLAARSVRPADCDDIVQDALVRAWRRWSTYDESRGGALPSIVADQGRRHRVQAPRFMLPLVPQLDGIELAPADIDLERAIEKLPARQRTAVNLRYFVDLDIETIAEVMSCAPGTVKATLHQARLRLRTLLGEDHD